MARYRPTTDHRRRIEDDSVWFKGLYYIEKYAVLWLPISAIITGLGFGLITPKMQINALQALVTTVKDTLQKQIDTNRQLDKNRTDSIMQTHLVLENDIKILLKLRCLDNNISARDKTLVGLDCAELAKK